MLNSEREKPISSSTPEKPKRSGRVPLWAKSSALALRASLAILTATPGIVFATSATNQTENVSIDNSGRSNIDDLDPLPAASMTVESTEVYKLYLNSNWYVIRGFRDEANFKGDFPIDRTRIIDNWGRTDIKLKVGQSLEISAKGKVLLQPAWTEEQYVKSCNDSNLIDQDGRRYWRDTVCPPQLSGRSNNHEAPRGMLLGHVGDEGMGAPPVIQVGSYWKGQVNKNGRLYLWTNQDTLYGTSGGFDITVAVYPPEPKLPPAVIAVSTPVKRVETVTTSQKSPDVSGWCWGLGAILLGGLAVSGFLRRGKHGVATVSSVAAKRTSISSQITVASLPRAIFGVIGGSSNPNTAPNPEPARYKGSEWKNGRQEFEKRWQIVKNNMLPVQPGDTGNEPDYVLERFKLGMGVVHEVLASDIRNVSVISTKIRAGIEYLIPEIWPNNRILKRFFDPRVNSGFITTEDLARLIYLPEQYRSLGSFTSKQRGDIGRIRRALLFALHPDKPQEDSDKTLQDSVDDLLKNSNQSWTYIEKLIN